MLLYSLTTFTLLQSVLIGLSISAVHLLLFLYQSESVNWFGLEFATWIFYHLMINLFGLTTYIQSIKHIRQHFHAYESNLYEKNKSNVDCKKLNTILGHCQQTPFCAGRMSKLSHGVNIR
jgi:hypothetical protein